MLPKNLIPNQLGLLLTCALMTANVSFGKSGGASLRGADQPVASVVSNADPVSQTPINDNGIRSGGYKAIVYNPFVYVTNGDLYDFQQALMSHPKNAKKRKGTSIDYSPYFSDLNHKQSGKRYSDFLVQLVRTYCHDINMPIPPKNEPLPAEAVGKLRAELSNKAFRYFISPFYYNLTDTQFQNSYFAKRFTKKYRRACCKKIRMAIKYFEDAYPGDDNLGEWKIFWSAAPSTAKEIRFGLSEMFGDVNTAELEVKQESGKRADTSLFPVVKVEVAFTGRHLQPVFVELQNPHYGIDIRCGNPQVQKKETMRLPEKGFLILK